MIISLLLLYTTQDHNRCRGERIIRALSIWQLMLLLLAHMLSVFGQLNRFGLLISYLLINVLVLAYMLKNKKYPILHMNDWKKNVNASVLLLGAIWVLTLALTIIKVPYNWDSMTYHLPRIAQWTQNESIQAFATSDNRQVASPILASYTNLFFFIWSNQEVRVLNLLQCTSYGMNAYLIYAIARKIGSNPKYASLATLLFMTMPIAFAEARTTQVDHYSTMWLLCTTYLILPLLYQKENIVCNRKSIVEIGYLAVTVALAYLAKPSVGFAILVLLIVLLVSCIRRKDKIVTLIQLGLLSGGAIVIILLPDWIRNLTVYGSLSIDQVGSRQLVGTYKLNYLFINFVKNFTFNIAPVFPKSIQASIVRFIEGFAKLMGVPLNHESISEDGRVFSYSTYRTYSCDTAPNVVVAIMMVICLIVMCIQIKRLAQEQKIYCIAAVSSFLVFCTALRWEPFVTRYMLSYLALLCPMIVVVLQQCVCIKRKSVESIVVIGLIGISGLYITDQMVEAYGDGPTYEISGYFEMGQPHLLGEYIEFGDWVEACGYKNIGLALKMDMYEYPLWRTFSEDDYEIRHVMVKGELRQYESSTFQPDCIAMVTSGTMDETIVYNGIDYEIDDSICGTHITIYH